MMGYSMVLKNIYKLPVKILSVVFSGGEEYFKGKMSVVHELDGCTVYHVNMAQAFAAGL